MDCARRAVGDGTSVGPCKRSRNWQLAIDDLTPVDALTTPSPTRIGESLRRRLCPPDRAFDIFLPEDLEKLSADQWTPLEVAVRVASWLHELEVRSVVDIGSGPGKFCVAAALAGDCEFVGLEQNSRFVAVARSLARLFGVQNRVRFVQGLIGEVVVPEADAYYLYNPFAQHLWMPSDALGAGVTPDYERYRRDVMTAQDILRRVPAGTVVITYNGFGGLMPSSFEVCRVDRELPCVLRMWRKMRASDDGGFSRADAD
jgi:SAM-dependent methyltransferase